MLEHAVIPKGINYKMTLKLKLIRTRNYYNIVNIANPHVNS